MENCIFCKIIKKEIPCHKVYEDEKFLGFLDIRPLNKGHCLVIPKEHYRWVWDVPNIDEYYKAVGKLANRIKKAMETDFVVSVVIGEAVPHAHVWLIPRYDNDGHGSAIDFSLRRDLSKEEMEEIARKINEA